MKLSRREFLGGVVAGALAAIAGKLPKLAGLPVVEEVAQAEAAQIETGIGRGSPRIFDNFGLSLPYMLNRSMGQLTLLGDHSDTVKPGDRISLSWTGEELTETWTVSTVRSSGDCTVLGVWPRGQYS